MLSRLREYMNKKHNNPNKSCWWVGLLVFWAGFLYGCRTVDEKTTLVTENPAKLTIAAITRNTPIPTEWIPTLSPTQTPAESDLSGWVVYPGCLPPACDQREIFLANLDTHEITQLTYDSKGSSSPVWLPDGQRIAFISHRNGNYDVYIMDADGNNQQQLTDYEGYDAQIDLSPDGEKIVFVSDRTGKPEIYILEIVTGTVEQLTDNHDHQVGEPSWSSDGRRIAYLVSREPINSSEIYIMDADGGNVFQVTNAHVDHARPTWCPDDTCLIYEAQVGADEKPKLMRMDLETGHQQRLLKDTPIDLIEWYASTSPQRGYIVFSTYDQFDMLYALDIENDQLYFLGLQAGDAALYP